jgi:hypothetical protein
MAAGQRMARLVALLLVPLGTLVLPTLILRPLLPPGMKAAWPIFAGGLTIAAFFFVASATYRWTQSRTTTAILTMASLATTLVGPFVLLLWALTSTWG